MKGLGIVKTMLVGILLVVLAACAPPGANPGGGESGSQAEGTAVEQTVEEATSGSGGGEVCEVEPPDIDLANATVGFSQSEEETNPFRITETASIEGEAESRGIDLISTNAQTQAPKQLSDIQDMLAQDVDVLIIAPLLEEGLEPALNAAKEQNVPVFLIDRQTAGTPCEDYITFMGSNFARQGEQAADKVAELTDGEAQIIELRGTPGASVATDRGQGFEDAIQDESGMEIVASQTANFVRTEGQQVTEQLLQSNPDVNAIYAHNDEMALGAIQAVRDAGMTPGEDVYIVGVDGTQDAAQAIVDGDMNATVTTNPRFGPLAFDTVEQFLAGDPIPQNIIVQDRVIDQSNAEEYLENGAY